MSPTYKTAHTIAEAAGKYGWEIVPAKPPTTAWDVPPWSVKKGRMRIEIFERRDGGICSVKVYRQVSGGSDCTYYPPKYGKKLDLVLRHIEEGDWLQSWMEPEWLKWWKGLDHSVCSWYGSDGTQTFEEYEALPAYQKCRSMHCAYCEKPCGSQGHALCHEKAKREKADADRA